MNGLLDQLTSVPAVAVYLIVALLVFAEDALLIGFLLPGETAAIIGGVTASTGHTNLIAMAGVVVAAAILGDSVGYQIGAHYGLRLLDIRPLRRRRRRIDDARNLLARRGGPAVLFGRFVAFLRAMMPFLSGAARMRYRTFFVYNAVGSVIWGVAVVVLGYLAGASYRRVADAFGEGAAIVVATLAVAAFVAWRVRRSATQRRR